jgi:hypothetical protein
VRERQHARVVAGEAIVRSSGSDAADVQPDRGNALSAASAASWARRSRREKVMGAMEIRAQWSARVENGHKAAL